MIRPASYRESGRPPLRPGFKRAVCPRCKGVGQVDGRHGLSGACGRCEGSCEVMLRALACPTCKGSGRYRYDMPRFLNPPHVHVGTCWRCGGDGTVAAPEPGPIERFARRVLGLFRGAES